jgi:hypothetical protein
LWLGEGNFGPISAFLQFLRGEKGETGEQGPRGIQGEPGRMGRDGGGHSSGTRGPQGVPGAQADPTRAITAIIDGGGVAIPAGILRPLPIPFDCTIVGWTLLSDVVGSIVIDLWKDTFDNYPPTIADTITAAAKPTIASANKAKMTTLAGWNTSILAGDVLGVYVESAATVTQVTFSLIITKTII